MVNARCSFHNLIVKEIIMPAIAVIQHPVLPADLNDYERFIKATVVSENALSLGEFSPDGFILPGVARWVDREGEIPVGYPAFTLQVRGPTKGSTNYKVTAKLTLPTLDITAPSTSTGIQPAPTKAYECTCIMEFILPQRSTSVERSVLLDGAIAMLVDVMTNSAESPSDAITYSPVPAAVINLEPPF